MAGEPDGKVGSATAAAESSAMSAIEDKSKEETKSKDASKKKKKKGFLSRIWNGLFGGRNDDFERRLERISKEESAVLTRMRRRAQSWGRMKRHLILFSVLLEVVAVGYAIMTARTAEDWKIRAFRVLPMFLLPALSSVAYSAIRSIINMCERKDQKTLENLRAERQAKIDELKEKTNYYITQQLIQRYDTDPAAKAAAATVLASKLGAESGLKVFLEDESKLNVAAGKSHDVELVQSSGLRNRKQPQTRGTGPGGMLQQSNETTSPVGSDYAEHNQPLYVDHYQPQGSSTAYNSGWLSRIAALLVGEDPTQCYALICGNCHMHNGLASKEDFPYVTYICPHCRAVNGPKIKREHSSGDNVSNVGSTVSQGHGNAGSITGDSPRDNPDRDDNNAKAAEDRLLADGSNNADEAEVSAANNES